MIARIDPIVRIDHEARRAELNLCVLSELQPRAGAAESITIKVTNKPFSRDGAERVRTLTSERFYDVVRGWDGVSFYGDPIIRQVPDEGFRVALQFAIDHENRTCFIVLPFPGADMDAGVYTFRSYHGPGGKSLDQFKLYQAIEGRQSARTESFTAAVAIA